VPKNDRLNIKKILTQFQEYEESKDYRKGAFKIEAPFEQAVKKIAKAKPQRKKRKH
jgi:hypothetical protein